MAELDDGLIGAAVVDDGVQVGQGRLGGQLLDGNPSGEAGASPVEEHHPVLVGQGGQAEKRAVVATGSAVEHDDHRCPLVPVRLVVQDGPVDLDPRKTWIVEHGGRDVQLLTGATQRPEEAVEQPGHA